jgi:hypothetical protein
MYKNLYETVAFEANMGLGAGNLRNSQLVETPPFEITVLNSTRPLSKTIKLKKDGVTLDKGRSHPMERGEALRCHVASGMQEFANVLDSLNERQAIAVGQLAPDLPDAIKIVTEDKAEPPASYGKTRENVVHVPGEPGLLLHDLAAVAYRKRQKTGLKPWKVLRKQSCTWCQRLNRLRVSFDLRPLLASATSRRMNFTKRAESISMYCLPTQRTANGF